MNEVELGKAVYGRTGFGHGWSHVEDNKDNIYRVLPPMKSLAREGKYAKFYSTHRGFRGTDNKQKPFLCIEESDYKTKIIKVHCPVCDWVDMIEKHVATFKDKGATDEQIREYRNKYLFPFQAERKYYLNVVNPDGKISVLPIGSKMFKSLEALAIEQGKAGRDITGMEGYYVNFKKQTRFKGDRDAIHTATLYMHPDGTGGYRPVSHVIDATFASRLGTEAADLTKLFKSLNIEQLAQLTALEGDARAQYVDSLFPKEAPALPAPAGIQAPAQGADPQSSGQATFQAPPTGAPAFGAPAQAPAFGSPAPSAPSLPPPQGFGAPAAPSGFSSAPPPVGGPAQNVQQAPAAPTTFTPPGNAPASPGAAPAFGGFGPSAPGGVPMQQLDDKAFATMVRPLNKG